MGAPEYVLLRDDHPVHRALKELDDTLELRFNTKLERYEVWNDLGFIQRVVGSDGKGFAEPGDWLIPHLKRLDARYVGSVQAVRNATALIDKHNLDLIVEREQQQARKYEALVGESVEKHWGKD